MRDPGERAERLGDRVIGHARGTGGGGRSGGVLPVVRASDSRLGGEWVIGAELDSLKAETAWDDLDVRSRKAAVDALMTVTVLPAGKGRRFTPEQVRIDWRS